MCLREEAGRRLSGVFPTLPPAALPEELLRLPTPHQAPSLPCGLRRTRETRRTTSQLPCMEEQKGESPAPQRQEGMAETVDGKQATEPLSVPRSSSGVPRSRRVETCSLVCPCKGSGAH